MTVTFDTKQARAEMDEALAKMSATPRELAWLYVRAAYEHFGRNISKTARELGMHRRTVQRMLQSGRPARIEE